MASVNHGIEMFDVSNWVPIDPQSMMYGNAILKLLRENIYLHPARELWSK